MQSKQVLSSSRGERLHRHRASAAVGPAGEGPMPPPARVRRKLLPAGIASLVVFGLLLAATLHYRSLYHDYQSQYHSAAAELREGFAWDRVVADDDRMRSLIGDFDRVVNDYHPLTFTRPLTTEEACDVFSFLFRQGYFRGRFKGSKDQAAFYENDWIVLLPEPYADFYEGPNGPRQCDAMRSMLANVNRRVFLRRVVDEVAADRDVYAITRWVAQNLARCSSKPMYTNSQLGSTGAVIDPAELLFLGYGQCGQINRVLAYVLKYGAGEDARLVSTPGHAFVEWTMRDGEKRLLDADMNKDRLLPPISMDLLASDYDSARRLLDIGMGGVHDLQPGNAYMQDRQGPAWYAYQDLLVNEEGTACQEVGSAKVHYDSPGRASLLFRNVALSQQQESTELSFEAKAENSHGPAAAQAWIIEAQHAHTLSYRRRNRLSWVKHVVCEAAIAVESEEEQWETITLSLPQRLDNKDYFVVLMASSRHGTYWGDGAKHFKATVTDAP